MATRAYSIEDGNISIKPITTSQTRTYNDIDLSFKTRTTGDIFKKTDANAIKQSIKNIVMTNRYEKPFNPYYGGNLISFLFSLDTDFDEEDIKDRIISSISNFEPRASVVNVKSIISSDFNSVDIDIIFRIIATQEVESLNISLTRLR